MCGICGVVSAEPSPEGRSASLGAMLDALVHRGPDGERRFEAERAALGVTRLSIIDLDGGWQPLYNEDRSIAVVANAEIYNFVELRSELEAKGHAYRSSGDCETIVHLYEEHGVDCVRHLRGMFAFALWDARRERLLLARDRMGEKPLYLYESGRRLIFASELKAMLASGRVPVELEPESIDLYFHYQFVPEPRTPLAGVRKLPPASTLTLDVRPWRLEERCYWRLEDSPPLEGEPVEAIRSELATASRLVTRSDVPLGIALSGGLDSSALAALLARAPRPPTHAFSVGYAGRPWNDERGEAAELARSLGMEFHEVELDADTVVRRFTELVVAWDDPIADMSGFGYHAISRLASEHGIRVLLQGQGGDELFWGYPWVRRALAASRLRGAARASGYRALFRYLGTDLARRGGAVEDVPRQSLRAHVRDAWRLFHEDRRAPHGQLVFYDLHPDFESAATSMPRLYTDRFRSQIDPAAPLALFSGWPLRHDLSIELTRLIVSTYLLENGIVQGDRLAMANRVELRLPLVDHRLVETVVGLRKTSGDDRKPAKEWLRHAMAPLLPEQVLARKKRPFLPPLETWHRRLVDAYGPSLEHGLLVELGILRPAAARYLGAGRFPPHAGSTLSFKALVLELWLRLVCGLEEADPRAAGLETSPAPAG